ncbi:hypothetical protein WBP07_21345 (plasmid) [Novosphingobium sp. BL-8A]|uniref:hypothetical protein n=1 Tax=Novosphingobium sp. BL-8A TaxID=3127639 RepID=UPI003758048D
MKPNDCAKLEIPVRPATIGAFLCLLGLCYQAHELGHHLFGAIVCGKAGTVDFSTYMAADGCARVPDLTTELFGPAISFAIAYGAALRLRRRASLFAFGCIFASYYHLRWVPPLMGGGDELDVARKLGFDNGWIIAALSFVTALPPMVIAWRAAAVRGRWWRVGLTYLLPLPFLLQVDALADRISGPGALIPALALVKAFNISASLLLADIILLIGFALMAARICWLHGGRVRGSTPDQV